MVSQRLLFCVLFTTVVSFHMRPHRNDLTFGKRVPGDKLAIKEDIKVPSKILRPVWALKTYNVPYKITYIRIFDNDEGGSHARVVIKNGGVSFKFVSIHFKSARGKRLDFTVEIYVMKSGAVVSLTQKNEEIPIQTSSVVPTDKVISGEASVGESSASESPAGEGSKGETPVNEIPTAESPADEASADATSADEAPVEDAPVSETSASEEST